MSQSQLASPQYETALPCRIRRSLTAKLLIVVEGINDVEFLRRISRILHGDDETVPDLTSHERAGRLIFLPIGGGDVLPWAERLAALGLSELHIYDRETWPETANRQRAAALVRQRRGCRAFVTLKRSLENYIHPRCLKEISGIELSFDDQDDVAEMVARRCHVRRASEAAWDELPSRAKKRCREHVKRWLNRAAVARMSAELLAERDPIGEVRSWLEAVAALMAS
jgi:hypothetical protein